VLYDEGRGVVFSHFITTEEIRTIDEIGLSISLYKNCWKINL
jgi:hypothetical protein